MGATFIVAAQLLADAGSLNVATQAPEACSRLATADGNPRLEVEVRVALADEDAATVHDSIVEHLEGAAFSVSLCRSPRVDLEEVLRVPADARQGRARVWVDRAEGRLRVLIAADTREQIYIRQLPVSGPVGELVGEQLGIVVETNLGALARGESIGLAREDATRALGLEADPATPVNPRPVALQPGATPPATARPTARRSRPLRLTAAAGYGVELWSGADMPRHGPHVDLHFGVVPQRGLSFGASIGALYHVPVPVESPVVTMRFQAVGGEAGAHIGWQFSVRLGVGAVLLAGAEGVRRQSEPKDMAFGSPSSWSAQARLGGMLQVVGVPSTDVPVALGFALGVMTDPVGVQYIAAGSEDPVFQPWRARPTARLTVGWGVPLGAARPQ